jgi:hypothetical protein
MPTIVFLDNDSKWAERVRKELDELRETCTFEWLESFERLEERLKDSTWVNDLSLALLDLELGPRGESIQDFDGQDKALPLLRERCPWVPAVLITSHLTGSLSILARVSTAAFDAVVSKNWLQEQELAAPSWRDFRRRTSLARAAAMTGRDPRFVDREMGESVELVYGSGVQKVVDGLGAERFQELMHVIGLRARRIVLDDIAPGFSGVAVLRCECTDGVRGRPMRARWLIKAGTDLLKLHEEAVAHRRLFFTGFTRRMSVPSVWPNLVAWNGLGALVYEFEEGAVSLYEKVRADGLSKGLATATKALQELYRQRAEGRFVPERLCRRVIGEGAVGDVAMKAAEAILSKRGVDANLSASAVLRRGHQHGDLHGRNILIGESGPVLIDFAKFLDIEDDGVPLLDFCKLAVDMWAAGVVDWKIDTILSGRLERLDGFSSLLRLGLGTGKMSDDEVRVAAAVCACLAVKYAEYDGIDSGRKDQLRQIKAGR